MNKEYRIVALFLLLGSLSVGPAIAASSPFAELMGHYQKIRVALVSDTLEGVAAEAREIEKRAAEFRAAPELAEEAVSEDQVEEWAALLQEIGSAAVELAEANEIGQARELFFTLTKPVSRYRKLAGDRSTVVAYCPMAKQAWLQPDGEIENPYLGQEMPGCGRKIPD